MIVGLRECVEGGVQKNEVGRLWGVDSTQTKTNYELNEREDGVDDETC